MKFVLNMCNTRGCSWV